MNWLKYVAVIEVSSLPATVLSVIEWNITAKTTVPGAAFPLFQRSTRYWQVDGMYVTGATP